MEPLIVFVLIIFWILPAAYVSSNICTGKRGYGFALGLLAGPLGIIIVLSIEYAKTVFQSAK